MLLTSILGIFLNIVIAWILAGGGLALFKEILIGIIIGPGKNPKGMHSNLTKRTKTRSQKWRRIEDCDHS